MVIENILFLQGDHEMSSTETPEVTKGHPDDEDVPNELADDAEVDALVEGVSTEPEDGIDGTD